MTITMASNIKIVFSFLFAALLWFAIFLQFYISIPDYIANGRTTGGAIVQLFSYFTIQTNLILAVLLTVTLLFPGSWMGRYLSLPHVSAAMAVYITIVGLVYHFMLRNQFHPVGMFKVTSDIFHIVSPIAYVFFWLLLNKKELLKWSYIFLWLLYPLIYTIYILIRGAFSNYYPYNFIDVGQFGYAQVSINCLFLLFGFVVLNVIFVGISRVFSHRQKV